MEQWLRRADCCDLRSPLTWGIGCASLLLHAALLIRLPSIGSDLASALPVIQVALTRPQALWSAPPASAQSESPTLIPQGQSPLSDHRPKRAAAPAMPGKALGLAAADPVAPQAGSQAPVEATGTAPISAPATSKAGSSGDAGLGSVSASPGEGSLPRATPGAVPPSPLAAPPLQPPAPSPEHSGPTAEETKALLTAYAQSVKAAILAQQSYPALARRLGHAGKVKVSFSLAADGSLDEASVTASSSFDELDAAALACLRAAAPFGAIPTGTGRTSLRLSITLSYALK